MKKIISLLVCVCLLISVVVIPASAEATHGVIVSFDKTTPKAGETVYANVSLKMADTGIRAFDIAILFPTDVFVDPSPNITRGSKDDLEIAYTGSYWSVSKVMRELRYPVAGANANVDKTNGLYVIGGKSYFQILLTAIDGANTDFKPSAFEGAGGVMVKIPLVVKAGAVKGTVATPILNPNNQANGGGSAMTGPTGVGKLSIDGTAADFSAGSLTVTEDDPEPVTSLDIEDSNEYIIYDKTWAVSRMSGHRDGRATKTIYNEGATATLTVVGQTLKVYGYKSPSQGSFKVQVDGGEWSDSYSMREGSTAYDTDFQSLVATINLGATDGTHTVVIKGDDDRYVILDYFVLEGDDVSIVTTGGINKTMRYEIAQSASGTFKYQAQAGFSNNDGYKITGKGYIEFKLDQNLPEGTTIKVGTYKDKLQGSFAVRLQGGGSVLLGGAYYNYANLTDGVLSSVTVTIPEGGATVGQYINVNALDATKEVWVDYIEITLPD